MSRLIQTYSTASRLSAAVFKKVITDVMQDKYRTSHLAPRDYSCFRQRSIIVASIATRCRSPQGQGRTGRFPFETAEIRTGNNTIFIRRYGKGSPLLMVHGFPRTSLMWRHVAPLLASNHSVICVDLRGYGRSGVPASAEDHYPYTKRAMADELDTAATDTVRQS
jgi:hypothetical protein